MMHAPRWRLAVEELMVRHWPGERVAAVYSVPTADCFLLDTGTLAVLRVYLASGRAALDAAAVGERLPAGEADAEAPVVERIRGLARLGILRECRS